MAGSRRYVIIGNGVAGTTAAEVIRKHDPSGRVTLIAGEPHPLYNRVALPRMLKGEIDEPRVMMRTVEDHERRGIELLLGATATAVDFEGRTVVLADGRQLPYDRLLVATGGRPRRLDVPGADAVGVCHFQTLEDTRALLEQVRRARRAVTVGGSYIAYELTEGFRRRGLEIVWLIRGDRFLRRVLDEAGGELVDRIARSHGVEVVYGEEVAQVKVRDGVVTGVVTTGGRHIDCDLVGAGLGLILNTDFLAGSPLRLGRGVVVDEYLQTDVPGVYAAGDVAEFFDVFLGGHHVMGTWNNAQGHGRVAGINMAGGRQAYEDVPYYTTTMFHSSMTCIGMTPESNPHLESETYVDFERENYRRLFFDEQGRLVGAVLIGSLKPRRLLAQLIRGRERVEDRQALLQQIRD